LLFHVGSDKVAIIRPRAIKRGFRALVTGSGMQVVFPSILPVAGNDEGRNRKTQQINTTLRDWCHWQNLGFFDHKSVYMMSGLLATDGAHLSQRGKRIFAQVLAGLTETAVNEIWRGKDIKSGSLVISHGAARQYLRGDVLVRSFGLLHDVLSTLEHIWNVSILMRAAPSPSQWV